MQTVLHYEDILGDRHSFYYRLSDLTIRPDYSFALWQAMMWHKDDLSIMPFRHVIRYPSREFSNAPHDLAVLLGTVVSAAQFPSEEIDFERLGKVVADSESHSQS